MKVRKAIVTAAGWGTRFLPATKAQPKEMLPLVDKPLIQYAVEEAVASGIELIIIITAMGKRAIEDHFDRSLELEKLLEQRGETKLSEEMRKLSNYCEVCYVRQKEQKGLGHAILTAESLVGNEPFAVLLPDDIIDAHIPVLKQMIDIYQQFSSSVVAVEEIDKSKSSSYGIIEPLKLSEDVFLVKRLVEKPKPEDAPSNLGIVGRYVLLPEVFRNIRKTPPGKDGEIQLTDALQLTLLKQSLYGYKFHGTRYDAGTPLGLLKASIAYGLRNEEIGPQLKEYLKQFC